MTAPADDRLRFAGVRALYGEQGYARLQEATVLVAGCGGVGSWLAEALCRTAVGALVLVDPDVVAPGNVNRQLPALTSTLGRSKAQVLGERLLDINPRLDLSIRTLRLTPGSVAGDLDPCPPFAGDAIDDVLAKAALLNYLYSRGAVFISAGGAGGRTDPGRLEIGDLAQSRGNALLASLRHELRARYGFPRGGRKMNITCVFSAEEPVRPSGAPDLPRFGTSMAVTASCGLRMAAHLIQRITAG